MQRGIANSRCGELLDESAYNEGGVTSCRNLLRVDRPRTRRR